MAVAYRYDNVQFVGADWHFMKVRMVQCLFGMNRLVEGGVLRYRCFVPRERVEWNCQYFIATARIIFVSGVQIRIQGDDEWRYVSGFVHFLLPVLCNQLFHVVDTFCPSEGNRVFDVSTACMLQGMRWCMEVGGIMMAAGACIKVVAVAPGRFNVVLLGQLLVGSSQIFILGAPSRVAALWFSADQLSTACAIGVFGNQMGAALGFLLTPVIVRSHDDPAEIGRDLKRMLVATAFFSTLVLVLIILLVKERPKLPPSPMQVLERATATPATLKEFIRSIGTLLTNRNYLLMLVSNGIGGGALNVAGTVLNPIILLHFPNEQQFAGRVGLVMILSGMLGSIVFGVLLDKTHKYKEITLGVYILLVLTNAGFAVVFWAKSAFLVYISAGLFGLFLFGFVMVSFEVGAEVTYPASENTMGGLLLIPANVLGCAMTMCFTWAMYRWGDFHANALMTASLVLGVVLAAFISKDYRRLAANTKPLKA
ncbi:hypothetical protein PR048_000625 [Dryococelus australis]|uniref:Uncharacterized protein n=1 Tax=Dryococelus australis TaxID=614101 RepID=A0ABQ9IGK6_9NEOP|nr:hypothetical protein PR048_000625 [Dryococelus australis]